MNIPLIIPAAGIGSRLFPTSWAVSKELFPIHGKPAIHHTIDEAKTAGIKNITCIISSRKDSIKEYLTYTHLQNDISLNENEKKRLNSLHILNTSMTYTFAYEEQQRGVGSAMVQAYQYIKEYPFFCMAYPDDFLEDSNAGLNAMINVHNAYNAIVIAVEKVPDKKVSSYGIIKGKALEKNLYTIESIIEKPSLQNAPSNLGIIGRYILPMSLLKSLTEDSSSPCFITSLNKEIEEKKYPVIAMEVQTTRYDIGTYSGWEYTNFSFLKQSPRYIQQQSFSKKVV